MVHKITIDGAQADEISKQNISEIRIRDGTP